MARHIFEKLRTAWPDEYPVKINELDVEGSALIHYCCALDFSQLLDLFDEFGVNLNVKSCHSLTPFIICAAKGNEVSFYNLEMLSKTS